MPRVRAKTADRGYSGRHPQLRGQWQPVVDAGRAWCHAATCKMPSRWIQPGTPWDLGHTPDRTGWTGPEHQTCNRAEGARRGNQMRGQRRAAAKNPRTIRAAGSFAPLRTSRNW